MNTTLNSASAASPISGIMIFINAYLPSTVTRLYPGTHDRIAVPGTGKFPK
jgi:hypothetical protein